ncbi:MAG: NifU family protein [Acidimicrobiales bacterium]|nr:NifU family protein [Acidimicrobiales bacterium]
MSLDLDAANAAVADDTVITVTEPARARLLELREAEPEGDRLGLRLAVGGVQGDEYLYDLSFQVVTQAALTDVVRNHGGLRVIVPADDVVHLQGATLDLPDPSGLVLRNPNRPRRTAAHDLTVTSELAHEVRRLLDEEVNPSLAAHGGYVELVGLDEGDVHLRMGGGCQGCAMSRMTMIQGVEVALKDALPAVTRVVDVTDHASGDNPYYR